MRILFFAPTAPFDTSFGSAQRTASLHRALSEHGRVEAVVVHEGSAFAEKACEGSGEVARLTVRTAPWYARYGPDADLARWIRTRLEPHRYDLVVARYLATAAKLRGAIDVPLVADADDALYRYAPASDSPAGRAVAVLKTHARANVTRRALAHFAHVWLTSARDRRRFPNASSSVLPNIAPDVPELPPPDPARPVILFVGALWYGPNAEAVSRFVAQCWPTILRRVPDARLRIVGACSLGRRNAWAAAPGVECPGFVDDLAVEYRAAHFTIAPVQYGGGTQIKTLESLAYGRTAVVSSFVHAGYSGAFAPGQAMLVADEAEDVIASCLRLLGDPGEAARMARSGRRETLERFGWPAFRAAVAEGIRGTASVPAGFDTAAAGTAR